VRKLVLGALACGLLAGAVSSSCNSEQALLRAKVIEDRAETVGGPVAIADVGDFLLENDQIRVAVLRAIDSPGPGVFGGSVVDIDRRRPLIEFQGGHGLDRFAETFPVANLMVPEPSEVDVKVEKDGSDGQEAVIRVSGQGEFLFEALGVLRTQQALLEGIFPNIKTHIRFVTDYVLRPGARHILIRTRLELGDEPAEGCMPLSCPDSCPDGRAEGPDGCLTCECSSVLSLTQYDAPQSVFGVILGDPPMEPGSEKEAGIVAGDFVFFGNQNDVFAPGPGFDEDAEVQRAFYSGRNTFQSPLVYDFVAAAGGDISYGYFTVGDETTPAPQVNVPLFASAATAFLAAGKQCLIDPSDDAACDQARTFHYERYLAVGDGDVASVLEEVYRVRGTPVGLVYGNVYWEQTLEPAKNAQLFVLSDPEPGRAWNSVDEVVAANVARIGSPGVVNAMDADLGLDRLEDGDFHASVPPGSYVVVARDLDATATSRPIAVTLRAGEHASIAPTLVTPATVAYRVTDDVGRAIPAKISFVSLDAQGAPLEGDGMRRPYFGDSRYANGVRQIVDTHDGLGEAHVEPGVYDVVVSRGIEYSVHRERVDLSSGKLHQLDAALRREVDTSGWMSADMHLHSQPSFDSGMPVDARVLSAAVEGVELAVSTDHDTSTDYLPVIRALGLEPEVATAIGAEITTLEQGHFIGFPLTYDATTVPTHGAHDWSCEPGGAIIEGIRAIGDGMTPLTIVAHPRDGFFGYLDQLGVDSFKFTREPPLLEADNPVFRTASCDFDAMELINSKRFDLVRTPTVIEVVAYNRCLARVNAAADEGELAAACPELGDGPLAPCADGELYAVCQTRARTALAAEMTRRVISRTPAEQDANWSWSQSAENTEPLCNVFLLGDDPIAPGDRDKPCNYRSGHVDDFFRLIEHGMLRTQIASSDSHNPLIEPGAPRTYFRSEAETPGGLLIADAVDSMRAAHVFTSYGPFIRASVDGKSYGEVAPAAGRVSLALEVQTASWFGVDRVEVYVNGLLAQVIEPAQDPARVIDVDTVLDLEVPARDSWIVVIAMGLAPNLGLGPVVLDRPFGEIQLANVASAAFSQLPVISAVFPPDPTTPDWAPTFPYAVTNPIYLDVDGNGRFDAPLPPPDVCSKPCAGDGECPTGQTCLTPEGVCGVDIVGRQCNRRVAIDHGGRE
jgi:hypothetical protein